MSLAWPLIDGLPVIFSGRALCREGRRQTYRYNDISLEGNEFRLSSDLDKHQNKNFMFRFLTVINKQEFQQHYKSGRSPKKFQLDSAYGMCFRLSLAFTLELLERSIGLEGQ